jgi:hypothetical protein
MSQLSFTIITNREEAKKYWDIFSPKKTIDEDFDFRDTWTQIYDFPFHFIVGFEGEKPIGLLPLQKNTLKGLGPKLLNMTEPFLEFFAGIDTDDNKVLILPGYEETIPQFLAQIDEPAILTSLKDKYRVNGKEAEHYIDRFELDLTKFTSFEDFLQKNLDGKSRQRLINRINKIHKDYTVEIKNGTEEDLQKLFQFSIDRFGDRSSFNMPDRQQIYREFLKNFDVDLFTIELNGQTKAISFCFVYNGSYISLNIGYDYNIRDISKLLVVTQMKKAIEKGCSRYDAGQGDNGWKEHFNLTKIPQYRLNLNLPEATS